MPPVIASVSAALISAIASMLRCVIRRMCVCTWNSAESAGSALMVSSAWRKAMLAIVLVGATNRNSAAGRRLTISVVIASEPE